MKSCKRNRVREVVKRLFDIVVCGLLLVVIVPVLALIALAIRLDSAGPILFRQERVGRGGQPFQMLKFRSMVKDAPSLGPYFTKKGDPRITRAGAFLRRTSLDELPQLINVLTGDMSLVGPRPDVPAQRQLYTAQEWEKRHRVRPGITGLAQATVRSSAGEGQRKSLDLEYVDRESFLLDLWILLLTVKQVLFKGSH
jgi:lipopolysaccharide/colanic/teichoic acid biosynthesis glycosyltransferase